SDLDVILAELAAYEVPEGQTPLLERPQLVALNKVDVPEARELAEMVRPDIEARGFRVFEISTVAREGLRALSFALAELVDQHRAEVAVEVPRERVVIRPKAAREEFSIRVEGGTYGNVYRVLGEKPVRWVQQTDFQNEEAVGYLGDRLERLGVEDALFKAGAVAGATVMIGSGDNSVVFDWEPSIASTAELMSPRGTDIRIGGSNRRTTAERREQYHEMMDARAAARAELEEKRLASREDEE
ncbi:MAG: Obg family GTPase CgtA, partial [Actinomycetota bacterium]|nr:Obg family GTPase CgtA [Actinomycetota bacterium]